MVAETEKFIPSFKRETQLAKEGYNLIAGVDEAGLGPLAGPVVAAAVSFDLSNFKKIKNLNDSKQLTEKQREELFPIIYNEAKSIGVGIISVKIIDIINIYWAGRQAMIEAIKNMYLAPDYLLIDGNKPLKIDIAQESIVKGDSKVLSIAAASIIAKVTRDRLMIKYHEVYPEYDFINNKGYRTPKHLAALEEYGITPIHRRSYKDVQRCMEAQ